MMYHQGPTSALHSLPTPPMHGYGQETPSMASVPYFYNTSSSLHMPTTPGSLPAYMNGLSSMASTPYGQGHTNSPGMAWGSPATPPDTDSVSPSSVKTSSTSGSPPIVSASSSPSPYSAMQHGGSGTLHAPHGLQLPPHGHVSPPHVPTVSPHQLPQVQGIKSETTTTPQTGAPGLQGLTLPAGLCSYGAMGTLPVCTDSSAWSAGFGQSLAYAASPGLPRPQGKHKCPSILLE